MLQSMRSAAKYIWIILIVAFVGSFLLYETSGLAGRAPVTTTTSIATVNGEEIHFRLAEGRIAYVPLEELFELAKAHTRRPVSRCCTAATPSMPIRL